MLVFTSSGDNITPPQQALGWVTAVWPTTESLVAGGQRIVFLLNPTVEHLGIFVSSDVARREHRPILESLDALEELDPGLYEMRILESITDAACPEPQFRVTFESRRVEDLPATNATPAFEQVREQSARLDDLYQYTLGPWARLVGGPALASALKWSHPMRTSRLGWAHAFNPFACGIDIAAAWAGATRAPIPANNPWLVAEARTMAVSSGLLDDWRRKRDAATVTLFDAMYELPDDNIDV